MQPLSPARTPRVTCLLPYRDAEQTVEEALDSLLSQQGVALQVIAIDDGSRDSSAEIVGHLAARHAALHCLSSRGVGIAEALNQALAASQTELLARMDADDISLPTRLQRQAEGLRSTPGLAALGTQVDAFPADQVGEGMRHYLRWQNALLSPTAHRHQLFVESPLCHPSVMLRRRAVTAVGGFRSGSFPEDYDLWLRLDAAGWGLGKLPHTLLRWRQHPSQATRTDPRYARARFLELKAPYLAGRLHHDHRPLWTWGAGKTGRRLMAALEKSGIRATAFIDIDPRKIGGLRRGAPIHHPTDLPDRTQAFVLVAVGARGARAEVCDFLSKRGFAEGRDYLCAS